MFDIIIKNGLVIDGSGDRKTFPADVGINGDKIAAVGDLQKESAKITIDAEGRYVAPGFVDVNNHSDTVFSLFTQPEMESMLTQGVTTALGGQCGSSLAPLVRGDVIAAIQKWTPDIREINVNWLTMAEFLAEIEKRKIGINFGTLVGHSTLRRGVLKDGYREATVEEIEIMKSLLEKAMKEGAFGISAGLIYSHAKAASSEEIIELGKIAAKYGGLYASHLRAEGENLVAAVNEAIRIGREGGCRIQISHLKAMGEQFWPEMERAIKMVETAKYTGLDINFDFYPYDFTGSVLHVLLPHWAVEGGRKEMLSRLKDPATRARIVREMSQNGRQDYEKIILATLGKEKIYAGKSIAAVAQNQEISPEEAIINILIANEGQAIGFIRTLSLENVKMAADHSLSFAASDGAGNNLHYAKRWGLVHPRSFGCFPRFWRKYVEKEKIIRPEEAVFKMTGGPARKIGLKDRGLLKKNYFADVVIFDPRELADSATLENPYQFSKGVYHVLVNGQIALSGGKLTGNLSGRVLRRS